MIRIYVSLSTRELMSADHGRYFLAYLKIRRYASKNRRGAYFTLPHFMEATNLKERAAKSYLKVLQEKKMILKLDRGRYRVIAQKNCFDSGKRNLCVSVTKEQFASFSLKSMARFRAFLAEFEYSRYKRHQSALVKGYTVINPRDKSSDRRKKSSLGAYLPFLAISCGSALTGFCESTIQNYRKLQPFSTYTWKPYFIHTELPEKGKASKGKAMNGTEYVGTGFERAGGLLVSPPSTRSTTLTLSRR
jgi:hypothetical protein